MVRPLPVDAGEKRLAEQACFRTGRFQNALIRYRY